MIKDPDSVLEYGFRWGGGTDKPWLTDFESVVVSTWIISPDDGSLNIDDSTHDATTTTVWLSGGTLRARYRLTNRIETNAGRTEDRTLTLSIRER